VFELYQVHLYRHTEPVDGCDFCHPPEPVIDPPPSWSLLQSIKLDKVDRRGHRA
jgi:hypothetical protein